MQRGGGVGGGFKGVDDERSSCECAYGTGVGIGVDGRFISREKVWKVGRGRKGSCCECEHGEWRTKMGFFRIQFFLRLAVLWLLRE